MQWQVKHNDQVISPLEEAEVARMLADGRLDDAALVRPLGKQSWKHAHRHGPFAEALRHRVPVPAQKPTMLSRDTPEPPVAPKDPARWDQQTYLELPAAREAAPVAVSVGGPTAGATSLVGGLFDLTFTSYVTMRVLRGLYVLFVGALALGVAGAVLGGLVVTVRGFTGGPGEIVVGIAMLVGGPVVGLFALVLGRIAVERVAVSFRQAELLAEISRNTSRL